MQRFDERMAEAVRLLDEGRRHLDARDFGRAEDCFRASVAAAEIPAARNNWALCRHVTGDPQGALEVLGPLLRSPHPAPFSRALASRAHRALGDQAEARRLLQEAVRDFKAGLASPFQRGGASEADWLEYAVPLEQAALELGEYRLVLDFYGRLTHRRPPAAGFCAGIAAFNLGRHAQAAKLWGRITDPKWVRPLSAYLRVAELTEQGVIPPLLLEGEPVPGPAETKDPETVREAIRTKHIARVPLLAALFDPAAGLPSGTLSAFIAETGAWGIELGRRILQAASVSLELKMEAAQALVQAGIFRQDEPIPLIHEGRPTSIFVRKVQLRGPDPELDRKVAQAKRLRDEGRQDEAYRLLAGLEEEGVFYPPAMVALANLRRQRGELDDARRTLEALLEAFPEDQAVLFNLAALHLQREDLERARQYAARLKPEGQPPEFQRRVRKLRELLAAVSPGRVDPAAVAESYRRQAEEKALPLELTLRRALKSLPVPWLDATAAVYQVERVPRRAERERLVADALTDPERLRRALAAEPPEVREALRLLLQRGGWCKLSVLTRRFGRLDGDGYWWGERPPTSTVGRLRLLGLVFVGRTSIEGQRHKVAVVPVELRPWLASYL
ncbi:MAG TPA: tetratricopeptide repeat protein [Firmicutes bacterium]|nr:tetratricopeptide repeat protein [Bacillota bacterium]